MHAHTHASRIQHVLLCSQLTARSSTKGITACWWAGAPNACVCVCIYVELVAVKNTYTDRRISLLCVQGKEGDYGALKTFSTWDNLRQEQGSAWDSLCVYVCLMLSWHFQDCGRVCVCVHTSCIRRTMQMIYLELSPAVSSSSSSSSVLYFCYLSFFCSSSLPTSTQPLLRGVHPKVNAWHRKSIFPPFQKLAYSLYVSKILTSALTQYPRAAKHSACQVSSSLCMFFRDRICWNEGCGFLKLADFFAPLLCTIPPHLFLLH